MAYDKVIDSVKLDTDLSNIAKAIANKTNNHTTYAFPNDFIDRINSIQTKVETPTEEKTIDIRENGITSVTPNPGKVLSKVTINVNVPTEGEASSNVEVVEFIPPNMPTFHNHKSGTFELWGWGIKDEAQAWNSIYYTFHGKQYAGAIDDTDHEMTLTIVNGQVQGIPIMTRGKCLAVAR